MATETNAFPEVTIHDFVTGEVTTQPMTEDEYNDYLATIEFSTKNSLTEI